MSEKLEDKDPDLIDTESFEQKFRRDYNESEKIITWNQYIRGFFSTGEAQCMAIKEINLTSYESVKKHIIIIYEMVSNKKMPPSNPWSDDRIAEFKKWMDDGCRKGDDIYSDNEKSKIMNPKK